MIDTSALRKELIEVTKAVYRDSIRNRLTEFDYAERCAELIESSEDTPTFWGMYRLTESLGPAAMVYAVQAGLARRRQRIAETTQWQDDGGR